MNQDDDIRNLFQQFDGRPEQYKEIARAEHSQGARSRWPLLDAVRTRREPIPPVEAAEPVIQYEVEDTPGIHEQSEVHDHGEPVLITPNPHKLVAAMHPARRVEPRVDAAEETPPAVATEPVAEAPPAETVEAAAEPEAPAERAMEEPAAEAAVEQPEAPQPTATAEPVADDLQTADVPEPAIEAQAADASEPVAESQVAEALEPVADTQAAVAPEPAAEAQAVAEPEPEPATTAAAEQPAASTPLKSLFSRLAAAPATSDAQG